VAVRDGCIGLVESASMWTSKEAEAHAAKAENIEWNMI